MPKKQKRNVLSQPNNKTADSAIQNYKLRIIVTSSINQHKARNSNSKSVRALNGSSFSNAYQMYISFDHF